MFIYKIMPQLFKNLLSKENNMPLTAKILLMSLNFSYSIYDDL